jgi:polyhydroxyalkanoate synthesis regulator protein
LPESFLRHLIGFYGDSLQTVLPRYLDLAMAGFARQQEQMRRSVEQAMGMGGAFLPFGGLEEVGKQQKAMMERAMSLFSPFLPPEPPQAPPPPPSPSVEALQSEIESLKQQLAALRETEKPSKR